MLTQTELKDRLARLDERRDQARDRKATARQAMDAARAANDAEGLRIAQEQFGAAHDEDQQVMALKLLALQQSAGAGERFGQPLANNLEALGVLRSIAGSSAAISNNINLGPILSMEATLGLFGGSINAAPVNLPDNTGRGPAFEGIVPTPTRPNTILDLFASRPFEQRTLDFLRRTGNVSNAAAVVEGAVKPEAAISYTPETAQAEVFASWCKFPRAQADDVSGLLADLQLALRTGVLTALEGALLNGNVAFDITGIKNATGVAAPVLTGVTNLADAAAILLRDLRISGVDPNFIAVSPTVYTAEMVRKTGDGEYIGAIADGRLWDVPVVQSIALDNDDIVAGDSRIAGFIAVRQPVHALVGTDQDDLVRNMLTCLVELRATPVITTPAALAVANLPAA
jgi:hypothetical protein